MVKAWRLGLSRDRLSLVAPFLALLPLATFGVALLLAMQADRAEERRGHVHDIANSVVVGLTSELNAALRALDALAGSEHLKAPDLEGFRKEAQRLLAREPDWFTIALTDGERQLMNLRYPPEATLPPIQDLAAVGIVLRTGHAALGGLFEGRVSFRVPVRVDGAVRYALVATQEPSTFSHLLNRSGVPVGWTTLLLDSAGRLIARDAGHPVEPEALHQAIGAAGTIVDSDGTQVLALPVGISRWRLVVAAPAKGTAQLAWVWLAAAIGLSALLSGFGIVWRLVRVQYGQDAQRLRGQGEAIALARARVRESHRDAQINSVIEDLHAPLNVLIGASDKIMKLDLPAEAQELVRRQRETGQAALAQVDDVLDFVRLERGALQLEDADIEIAPLLDDCAAQARPAANAKGLSLTVAIDPGLPHWIRGDPLRLRQVVGRLLSHAIHSSIGHSSLGHRSPGGASEGHIILAARLTPRPEQVEITVTDSAPTLVEPALSRLFEGFEGAAATGAGPGGAPGLVLAICRRLVEAMGGRVRIKPLSGHGNLIQVALPFRPGAAPASPRGGGALRILVAEDVPASRLLLKAMLEHAGHQVTEAADGPTTLAALHGATFDMVVMDLHMPSLGGLGVARVVRSLPGEKGRVPLIALTADPADRMQEDCLAAGFDAMLRKPYETRRLLGLIDSLRGRLAPVPPPADPPDQAAKVPEHGDGWRVFRSGQPD